QELHHALEGKLETEGVGSADEPLALGRDHHFVVAKVDGDPEAEGDVLGHQRRERVDDSQTLRAVPSGEVTVARLVLAHVEDGDSSVAKHLRPRLNEAVSPLVGEDDPADGKRAGVVALVKTGSEHDSPQLDAPAASLVAQKEGPDSRVRCIHDERTTRGGGGASLTRPL